MQKQQTDIDFSPLQTYRRSSWEALAVPKYVPIAGASLTTLCLLIALGMQQWLTAILLTISYGVWLALWQIRAHQEANTQRMLQFAAANPQLTYVASEGYTTGEGTLFTQGHSKLLRNIIGGNFQGFPFRTYQYDYSTGSGKNRHNYQHMVMEITLPRVLPHLVIDSQLEDVLPITFERNQKLELEGDFHKYFDVYAPDTYAVSALTILAPDSMEVVMRHCAHCDIEIVQNKLYLYWAAPPQNQQGFMGIFDITQRLLGELSRDLTRANIYKNEVQSELHATPTSQGARLKTRSGITMTILFVVLIVAMQFANVLSVRFESFATSLPFIAIVIALVYAGFRWRQKARSQREHAARYGTRDS